MNEIIPNSRLITPNRILDGYALPNSPEQGVITYGILLKWSYNHRL